MRGGGSVEAQTVVRDTMSVASPEEDAGDQSDLARRRGGKGGWSGKPSIIEQINELIEELADIDSNIAIHVSLVKEFLALRGCGSVRESAFLLAPGRHQPSARGPLLNIYPVSG